jgi:hypothetical protein
LVLVYSKIITLSHKTQMKKNIYSIGIGLLVGMALPIVLFFILVVADGILINVAYSRFHASVGLNKLQVFALLVPLEIISLFFFARFNKRMAVAALFTATGVTLLLLNFLLNLADL